MFKNGKVAIVTLQSENKIDSTTLIDVKNLPQGKILEVGYFIKVGGDILFINNYVTIKVDENKAEVIEGYSQYEDFESVVALEKNYFAVVNASTGVYIYEYNGTEV